MPLAPLAFAPKLLNVPLTATGIAPTLLRVAPFWDGNDVMALSAGAAALRGACFDRGTAKKSLKFIVPPAAITAAAGKVGIAATWNTALTQVTGVITLTLGSAAGNILDSLPNYTTAADADEAIAVVVLVNGKPFGRIVDANAPAPAAGQWGMDDNTADNYNVMIFADTTDFIPVGAEIEVLITSKIGALAYRTAAGVLTSSVAAGADALVAGVAVSRRLGVAEAVTDTAGRSTVALAWADVVMSEVAATALFSVGL